MSNVKGTWGIYHEGRCIELPASALGMKIINKNLLIATTKGVYRFKNNKLKKIKFKNPDKIILPF